MELRAVVFAGALAGFVASVLNSMLWQPLWVALSGVFKQSESPQWRQQRASVQLTSVAAHIVAGATLGFLYWLSWALTGIVSVPWWFRGLSFAGLTWGALCLPLLLSLAASAKTAPALIAKSALEWLATCTLVGLACAWSWAKGP